MTSRGVLIVVVLVVASAVGGFLAGKQSHPAKVVEKIVAKEDTAARTQVRELQAQLEEYKRHTVRTVVVKYTPEGQPAERTEVTDTHVDRTRDTLADLRADVEASKSLTLQTETTVIHNPPDWFAGVIAVASPTAFNLVDPVSSLSVGAMVGRRILGPVSVGVTATVPVRQPLQIPAVGVTLTVGF